MEALLSIPALSSYQSCIKFHGKPILPPLVSYLQRQEINEFQKRAVLVEEKHRQRKSEKDELMQKQEALEEYQNVEDSANYDILQLLSDNTLPFDECATSSATLKDICEEEEEVIMTPIDKIDSANEEINKHLPSEFVSGTSESSVTYDIESELQTTSHPSSFPNICKDYFGIQDFQKSIDGLEVCSKSEFSESEDVEYPSLVTVIANEDLDTSRNTDSNSISRSSDLGKYFDCSIEDAESSRPSTALEQDIDALIIFSSSTDTIVDCSVTSTPVVPSMLSFMNHQTNCSLLDFDVSPDSPILSSFPAFEKKHELDIEFVSCVDDPLETSPSEFLKDIDTATEETYDPMGNVSDVPKPSGHKRTNSYTIEVPSPVLLESHANCPCLKSPTGSTKPHCSWVNTESSVIENFMPPVDTKPISDAPVTCPGNPLSVPTDSSKESMSVQEEPITNEDALQRKVILEKLFEEFKKIHNQKVEHLLEEQQRQWEVLNLEFKQQEEELQKQMSALSLSNKEDAHISPNLSLFSLDTSASSSESNSNSENGMLNKTQTLHQDHELSTSSTYSLPTKISTSCPLPRRPSTCDQSCIPHARRPDDQPAKNQELVHLQSINDPEMQKKFEKVSAVAKGFLTRRLLNSTLVQKIKAVIVETVMATTAFYRDCGERGLEREEDIRFHGRLLQQLNKAFEDIHYIFFETTPAERMKIIAESSRLKQPIRDSPLMSNNEEPIIPSPTSSRRKLSSATLKRLERRNLLSKERTMSREKLWKNDDNSRLKKASSERNVSASQKKTQGSASRTKSTSPPVSSRKNRVRRNCFSSAGLPCN